MTADGQSDSFGPYAFTLEPAEAEAAAARAGLRRALKGGLLISHVAPLTAFAMNGSPAIVVGGDIATFWAPRSFCQSKPLLT